MSFWLSLLRLNCGHRVSSWIRWYLIAQCRQQRLSGVIAVIFVTSEKFYFPGFFPYLLKCWSVGNLYEKYVGEFNLENWQFFCYRILYSYDAVNKAIIPILFLFGTIGNALSLTVFCMAPSHRHLSSSYYLSALAISDTGFLINLLAVWLEDMGYRVITSGLMCPLVMYLGQVTCFLSVWLTVSFTVERFFAVCYPLTRPTVCTVARAKKVISVLTLSALIAFSYVWLIARVLDYPMPPGNPITDADGAAVMGGGGGSSSEILERMSPSLEVGNFSLENISGGATIPACAEFTIENTSGGEPQQADMFSAVLSCNNGTAAGSLITLSLPLCVAF